ncbi:MAG: beta-lactamase family protein, partial [Actinomycetota bacterium]|nr:beta-lactamase family protein [Actinomycetota bacterium]
MPSLAPRALPRSAPQAKGVAAKDVLAFLDRLEAEHVELHSLMLLRHGHVLAEGWWDPYHRDGLQLVYSLSKSVTSTAVGFAAAEGRLSLDAPVASFLDADATAAGERARRITVRHLLTMSSGHRVDTLPLMVARPDESTVSVFLSVEPQEEPGHHFLYHNGATATLAAIVQTLVGARLTDYLRPRLFDPIGIGAVAWQQTPAGQDLGFSGLHLTTEAIARFGQLYLADGRWGGQQVLPPGWVAEATRYHVDNAPAADSTRPDWGQGYGYQFWRGRHGSYRGDGAYGQFCLVLPEFDAVLAITASTERMQAVLDAVWQHLIPGSGAARFGPAASPAAPGADELRRRLLGLALAPVKGARSPRNGRITAITADLSTPALALPGLTRVRLEPTDTGWVIGLDDAGESFDLGCGYGRWTSHTLSAADGRNLPVRTSGAWTGPGEFTARITAIETPHQLILTFQP